MSEEQIPRGNLPTALDGPAEFRRALFAQTPRVWVTPLLVGINVAVFVAMVASGVGLLSPSIDGLIAWGANYGPRTTGGQWWRLLTSAFVHIGVFHIAMNMIGLWQIGFLVERLLGNRAFLVAYLFSGLCGSLASVAWNPVVVSAGASGAVFGVYGVLIAYLIRHRGSIPREILQPLQKSAAFFVVLNVVYGFQLKGIDMAAHVGGLLGGLAAALLVTRPLGALRSRGSTTRQLLLVVAGLAVLVAGWALLPRAVDIQAVLADFPKVEGAAVDAYNGALGQRQANQLSDDELAKIIDEQVLPPWRALERRLGSVGRLPPDLRKHVDGLVGYMELRGRAWATTSDAIRTGDPAKNQKAVALQKEAEAFLKAPQDGKTAGKKK